MTAQDVLLDWLEENNQWVHWLLEECSEELLYWQADAEANNMAVTLWHCARVFDLFLTQHIHNQTADNELWWANGWAEKTGYDPRGIGDHGWGTLQGYTAAEVQAIPPLSKADLQGYFAEVTTAVKAILTTSSDGELTALAPGFGGKYSVYFWIKTPLSDLTRHIGEMLAIKAMWERHHATNN